MSVLGVITQLRTTDLDESIAFYTGKLGMDLDFLYQDFYAGINAGGQVFHLKRVDGKDPGIDYVARGEHLHLYFKTDDARGMAEKFRSRGIDFINDVQQTPWGTLEFAIKDNQGHVLYFGQNQ